MKFLCVLTGNRKNKMFLVDPPTHKWVLGSHIQNVTVNDVIAAMDCCFKKTKQKTKQTNKQNKNKRNLKLRQYHSIVIEKNLRTKPKTDKHMTKYLKSKGWLKSRSCFQYTGKICYSGYHSHVPLDATAAFARVERGGWAGICTPWQLDIK